MPSYVGAVLNSHDIVTKGTPTTVDGQPAIRLLEASGGETFDVAAAGIPYPLEDINREGTITFESWNQPLGPTAPGHSVSLANALSLPAQGDG